MAISQKQKQVAIAAVLVVGAYLLYKWYKNRQAQNQDGSTGLGTNLNSAAPALVAGSAGPVSGLQYYQGATNISLTEPISQSSSSTTTTPPPPPVPPPGPHPHPHPWPWPPRGWHPPHWEPPPASGSRLANAISAEEMLSGVPYNPAGANTSGGSP